MNKDNPTLSNEDLLDHERVKFKHELINLTVRFLEDQKMNGSPEDAAAQLRKEMVNSKLEAAIENLLMLREQ